MSRSGLWLGGRGRRRLGLGVVVAAGVIAVIVIATQSGSKKGLPVFAVVAHTVAHAGSLDHVEAMNKSRYQVGMTSCGLHVTPRTSAGFSGGPGRNCGDYETLAPHSNVYVGNPTSVPGKYWVWFGYRRQGSQVVRLAYAKLTVVGPVPQPVSVVLAHATVHRYQTDAVTVVNKSSYPAHSSGYGCTPSVSPRTSSTFKRGNAMFCAGGGPEIPAHARVRVATSITPAAPGKYWVYFDYSWGPSDLEATAHAKLTVLGY